MSASSEVSSSARVAGLVLVGASRLARRAATMAETRSDDEFIAVTAKWIKLEADYHPEWIVMDATSIAAMATSMSSTRVASEVATTVFKKALDVQEQTAMQLLEALPQPPSNPPHLGNSVDVKA